MKRAIIFLTTVFCFSATFSQTINQKVKDGKGNVKLLGVINKEGLTQAPFNVWFSKNHANYLGNDKIIEKLKDSLIDYEIVVFLGTWCGDSKREVPRFYNILEATNFPEEQLKVIAVDNEAKTYKQSPTGEEKGLNIHRVPTFIFYKNGKEINRIVESPVSSLERDILSIVSGEKYSPNYIGVSYLNRIINSKSLDSLRLMEKKLVPRLSEFVMGSRELNTFGYVLLRSNQFEKAAYVFDLNTKIFPYKYNVYDSLGEAYFEANKYKTALNNYTKVLELNPKDKNAKVMIEKIKDRM